MSAMQVYSYFGLARPPFEAQPDPRFFYPTDAHVEALAAMRYAVRAGKTCTLVLGDSGSGKTLLGRLLGEDPKLQTPVLWIHGIGQPAGQTEVAISSPRRAGPGGLLTLRACELVAAGSLAEWIRAARRGGPVLGLEAGATPTAVLVDNADALPAHSWEDILTLVTREPGTPGPTRPVSLVLLGLPTLVETLAAPALVRLQRRIFRTCRLARLSARDTALYVRHRLTVAGGGNQELFTPAAVDLIHRFSDGNPALVNQLCDNAMVDAFADERRRIDARHVMATVNAISGGVRRQRYLPSPVVGGPSSYASPVIPEEIRTPLHLRQTVDVARDDLPADPRPVPPPPEFVSNQTATLVPGEPSAAADSTLLRQDYDGPTHLACTPLDERLRALERRLSEALARVREARGQPLRDIRSPAATDDVVIEDAAS